jgi:hypothetical protein
MIGAYALSAGYYDAFYLKAQKVRQLISEDFKKAFNEVDLIMGPVSPSVAFELGSVKDPVSMYLADIYTLSVNLAGASRHEYSSWIFRQLACRTSVNWKPLVRRTALKCSASISNED